MDGIAVHAIGVIGRFEVSTQGACLWRGGVVRCEMCTPLHSGTLEDLSIRKMSPTGE